MTDLNSDLLSKEEIISQMALADMKTKQEAYNEAIAIYKEITERTNDFSQASNAFYQMAIVYYKLNDFDNAIWAFEKCLPAYKNSQYVNNMLGFLYFYKDIDKSIFYYLKGMEIKPELKNFVMLTQVMIKSNLFSQKDLKETFEKYIDFFRPSILNGATPFSYNKKDFDKNKKLKIGYLSSDFFCHAMMSFVLPIIENHDYNKFDVVLYSCRDYSDAVTERIKKTGAEFKDCSKMTYHELAQAIHNDKIDILIDLCGYTHKNDSLWSLLYKPAPIITQFLGFLGTYGIKEVDYILADKTTIPRRIAKYYTEKPMYINGGMNKFAFQIKNNPLPMITPLPYEENHYITFGSFNAMSKINSQTLELWSNVLKAVPNSKLLIYRTQMEQKDIDRFTKTFNKNEIPLDRIIFDKESMPESHFKCYLKCDIALDPIPFSGLTITIEQAFMGVPSLTMSGETISSKGTERVNRALKLKNFIAKDKKDYVKKAVKIASDIKTLRDLRKNLPTIIENSYLCKDFKKYAENIEKEYIKAWKNFCK